ncbi:MAG: hypothetical protein PHT69_12320 [Bacteroidales bacterium]|nr:hypothetical protein [Bacteroidales bacterium]
MKVTNSFIKCLFFIVLFTGFHLSTSAQFSAGLGFVYGTAPARPGLNIRGGFFASKSFEISADFSMYKSSRFMELNINAQYYINIAPQFVLYPKTGFNLSHWRPAAPLWYNNNKVGGFKPGINVGAGVGYHLGDLLPVKLMPFFESKYVISRYNQLVLTGGVIVFLSK